MSCNFDFVEGDNSKLVVTCLDSAGNAIDLTGATITLSWVSAYPNYTPISKTMTITDAVNGVCEYQFLANELYSPKMDFDVEIVDASGDTYTSTCALELLGREKVN